jgi:SdiA-regulated protein
MSIRLFFLLTILVFSGVATAQIEEKKLELIDIKQLDPDYKLRFDLSGLVIYKEKIYAIADKDWNNFMYEIDFNDTHWYIKNTIELDFVAPLDLEGIENCNDTIYIVDETTSDTYWFDKNWKKHVVNANFQKFGENPHNWERSKGLEGIAIDCETRQMYLAKEREPRFILEMDMSTKNIYHKFNIPEAESNDFTDLRIENGYLYLLERNGNYIAKVDLKTYELVDKYTYKHICRAKEGKLYEPTDYGMAEALLLFPDEIWIGLDNNDLEVSEYAQKKYGLTGKNPAILKFKRPEGF